MIVDYIALGKHVAKYRKLADYTQEQLAESSGLSLGMISTVETGKTKASIETLVKLANSLDTTVDILLYDSLDKKKSILLEQITRLTESCSKKELELLASSLETQITIVQNIHKK